MTKFSRITHMGGVFLEVSHAPTTSGCGLSGPQFWGSLLFLHTPFYIELPPNFTWYHIWGGGLFLGVSHAPTPWCGAPALSKFWEFPSIYAYTLYCRTTKCDMIIHVGEGHVSWVSHASHPSKAEFHSFRMSTQVVADC